MDTVSPRDRAAPAAPSDSRLAAYLQARTEAEADAELALLLSDVRPIVEGIVRRKWLDRGGGSAGVTQEAAQDLCGEVVYRLLRRLRAWRERPAETAISSFEGYVAVTAYRVCDDFLRAKYPQRSRVKNRLLYLLNERAGQLGFASWEGADGERYCGFAAWRDQDRSARDTSRFEALRRHPTATLARQLPALDVGSDNPGELLAALLNWVGGPVEVDALVGILATLWGVTDRPADPPESDEGEAADPFDSMPDPRADVQTEVAQRFQIRQLWQQVCELPRRQRVALLLNLRDGQGSAVIALLPTRGIATIRQIAAVLELSGESFALLWNELPMDDQAIAELLGATRQQIVNLRMVARRSLARRMEATD